MSSYPELLGLGVGIDTSAAEAGLASLGGSAEGVAAGLEDRLAGASEGMKDLGKQSSQASRGIQGLAAVVSLVDPRLGQVVRSVGTLTRGLSILRLGMGAAIPVVAAVTGALYLYQQRAEAVADEERRAQAISDAMRESRERLRDSTIDLEEEVRGLSDSERKLNAIRRQSFVENLPAVQEFTRQISEQSLAAETARNAMETYKGEVEKVSTALEEGRANQTNLNMAASRLRDGAVQYQQETEALEQLQVQYGEFLGNIRQTIDNREKELQIADQRSRQRREEVKDLEDLSSAQRDYYKALEQVADIEQDALAATMTERQRLTHELEQQLALLEKLAQQEGVSTGAAEAALRAQYEHQLGEIRQREHEAQMRRIEAEEQAARDAAMERLQVGTDLANNLAGLATASFGNTKTAQIAEARLAQLLAFANAIARDPTPLGALRGAAAAASIEAQIQSMRGTTLTAHRGYVGDEVPATYRRGEAVLSPQGRRAIGDDTIRRANAGRSTGQQIIQVRQMYEHRGYNRFADDNLKIGGPLREAIRTSSSTLTGFDAD